ncbi:MAG: hypothetical protein NTW38_08550 [Candidatus Aminicenantes bacterium]|nr:hypothetical protein [Candidatus Aminicenantes bacterium]
MLRRNRAESGRRTGAVLAFILAAALIPLSSAAAEKTSPAERGFGPLEKSLILPGWGQISEHRILKGAAFAAAELACLAGVVYHNRRGNSNYDLYKSANDAASASRYRDLVERHDGRRNACLLAAAAVWAANLLDIYLIVHRQDQKTNARSLTVGIHHGPSREICLSVGCRF